MSGKKQDLDWKVKGHSPSVILVLAMPLHVSHAAATQIGDKTFPRARCNGNESGLETNSPEQYVFTVKPRLG